MDEAFQTPNGDEPVDSNGRLRGSPSRRMERAELLGAHTHRTVCGTHVHVWRRQGRFLARGSYRGKRFGQTLGEDSTGAAANLRRLLVDIENGAFQRPSERPRRPLATGPVPRLSIRELCDAFLAEKRYTRGKPTMNTYRGRLTPLIEFAELPESRKKWPLAMRTDREFALAVRQFLSTRQVTRNGKPGGRPTTASPRHVFNMLDCARSLFHWAKRPEVNKLPVTFVTPFTADIVGEKPRKDPLRPAKLPMEMRIKLVGQMDVWQMTHFAIPMVLALRPEDYVGLLVSEVNWTDLLLRFGTRFGGRDFNKCGISFVTPFPREITPLLVTCIGDRADGPLLRSRAVFEGRRRCRLAVESADELAAHIDRAFDSAPDEELLAPPDQKALVRRTLRKMGGASEDGLAKEFKKLLARIGADRGIRFYDLRGAANTDMDRAGVSKLVQLYVTGHEADDIRSEYVSLDLVALSEQMAKYFAHIRPLLESIRSRAIELGLCAQIHVA